MIALQRLRVLREFAGRGTVAAAAEALAYTPSAVSQQLAQLEREAAVQLFRHVGRRLELTDAGRALVGHAETILDQVERAEADLAAHGGAVRGTVRIAAFQLAATSLALPAMALLTKQHPALEAQFLEAEAETSLRLLQAGRIDVAIAEEYEHAPRPRHRQLERTYLGSDEMLLVLPHRHAAADDSQSVALKSLRNAAWATAAEGTAYADMFLRLCRGVGGFEPSIQHRANDFQLLLDLAAQGHAATLLPALGGPGTDPRVHVRQIAEGSFPRRIFVTVRAADRQRPAIDVTLRALVGADEHREVAFDSTP